ncbi:ATP-binding cassette domain-containing protein [Xanthobacteraceae bacterium A53D]
MTAQPRLAPKHLHHITADLPVTLQDSAADLFIGAPGLAEPRFVATLSQGALLPLPLEGVELHLRPRQEARLEAGGDADGAMLWLEALGRAAGIEVEAPESLEAYRRTSAELLARVTQQFSAERVQEETARSGAARQTEDAYAHTLGSFGRLLDGTFHRPPVGIRTPLASAAAKLAEALHVKVLPTAELAGEGVSDFLHRFGAAHGLRLRRLTIAPGEPPDGEGALLVFDADGQPWVLRPRGWGGFLILHPTGDVPPRKLKPTDWQSFSGTAYAFYRTLPAGKLSYGGIFTFGLRDSVWDLGLLLVAGLVGAVLALLPPLASAQIANIAVHSADVEFLVDLLLVLGVALIAETCFFMVGKLAELRANGRSSIALHAAMVDRLLRLTPAGLRGSTTLILATQMETVEKFRRALLGYVTSGVVALVNGLAAAVLVMFVSPGGGLAALGLVLLLVAAAALIGWAQFKAIYEGERMDVIVLAFVYDLVRLVPLVRAQRLEKQAFTQWSENFLAFQSRIMRSARITNRLAVGEPLWDAVVLATCFAVVAYAGSTSHLGVGLAITFVLALGRLMQAGKELAHHVLGASKLMPMAKLARPFIEQVVEPLPTGAPLASLDGRIEASDVSFFHGTRRILQDVSLDIPDGAFIGLVGPSGSGKSTLLSLLSGLDRPSAGRILIGGHDIAGLDRQQVARRIGLVLQNSRLLPGTLYENIRGITDISQEEAFAFAEQAALADEIRALPMGLNTIIGESGAGLSEGQIQRILIARALARRPSMLMLDEAMSALDGATQQRILAALEPLELTRIVVAHRPSTLERADLLVVLRDGQVIDVAPPAEVIARHSFFQAQGW